MLPFKENIISEGVSHRTFYEHTDSGEFMWHRDREDRLVESLGKTDWKVQIDNELPKSFDGIIFIPAGVYHRIIKGTGDVTLKIQKIQ